MGFLFTDVIIYSIDTQICQILLRLFFLCNLYCTLCVYDFCLGDYIYLKLVRYIREMSKYVTISKAIIRAQRELKIVRRTVVLITILIIVCFPCLN